MVAKYRYTVTFSDGVTVVFVSDERVDAACRGLLVRRGEQGFSAGCALARVRSVSCESLEGGAVILG